METSSPDCPADDARFFGVPPLPGAVHLDLDAPPGKSWLEEYGLDELRKHFPYRGDGIDPPPGDPLPRQTCPRCSGSAPVLPGVAGVLCLCGREARYVRWSADLKTCEEAEPDPWPADFGPLTQAWEAGLRETLDNKRRQRYSPDWKVQALVAVLAELDRVRGLFGKAVGVLTAERLRSEMARRREDGPVPPGPWATTPWELRRGRPAADPPTILPAPPP